jgi:hypothetical protein
LGAEVPLGTEKDIFEFLGVQYYAPEHRSWTGMRELTLCSDATSASTSRLLEMTTTTTRVDRPLIHVKRARRVEPNNSDDDEHFALPLSSSSSSSSSEDHALPLSASNVDTTPPPTP